MVSNASQVIYFMSVHLLIPFDVKFHSHHVCDSVLRTQLIAFQGIIKVTLSMVRKTVLDFVMQLRIVEMPFFF